MRLKGKVAIITGGSRGIGYGISELFAKEGASVIITSQNEKNVKDAQEKIPGSLGIVADVRKMTDVENVIKKTIEKFGRIDILVNNAGIFPKIRKLHEIPEEEWNQILDVNLSGPYRFAKAAIPYLAKNGGSIINISSDAGLKAYQGFNADAYSASKAALNLLTQSWALQYAKDKIRVNCVCPGVVDTDMTAPFVKTPHEREMMNLEHPIGRMGIPEDIAKAVLYLASDDASWTTGAILAVDGGESIK